MEQFRCPSCGGTEVSYVEYVANVYQVEGVEDGTLIVQSGGEIAYEDTKDKHLWCEDCDSSFPVPENLEWR